MKKKSPKSVQERGGYNFYRSYYDVAEDMNDEQRGQYYHALLKMQFEDLVECPSDPIAKMAFKGQLYTLNQQLDGFKSKIGAPPPSVGGTQGGTVGPAVQEQVQVQVQGKEKVQEVHNSKITINPKKDLSVIDQNQTDQNSFQIWWNLYAKKVDQKKCFAKWKKYDHQTRLEIYHHTKKYIEATPDKQFRRNPLTYLNGENWKDAELLTLKAKNAAADQKVTVADFFRDTIRAEVPGREVEWSEQKQLPK